MWQIVDNQKQFGIGGFVEGICFFCDKNYYSSSVSKSPLCETVTGCGLRLRGSGS